MNMRPFLSAQIFLVAQKHIHFPVHAIMYDTYQCGTYHVTGGWNVFDAFIRGALLYSPARCSIWLDTSSHRTSKI